MASSRSEAIGKLEEQLKKSKSTVEGYKKEIADLVSQMGKLNVQANKVRNSLKKVKVDNSDGLKQSNIRRKEAISLANQNELLKQKEIRTQILLRKEQERLGKIQARSNKLVKDQANAYRQLTAKTNEAQAKLKQLATQYGVNSKQARRAKIEFNRLDKQLRSVNNAARDGRRDVGRYGLSITNLKGAVARLGVAFGGLAIIRNVFGVVKDFEQGQADLASVLGINVNQMSRLTEQAKELGATTTFTASQVSELQKEFAKLGFTQSEIENVTEATLLLAEATGTDLARAAEVTGGIIRGFGLDANETTRVTNVMASSFSKSGLDMEKFAETMKTAAPIAKVTGISLEQATAAAGVLANNMISGSKAGTDLKKIFSELVKDGKPFEESLNDISKQLNGASTKAEKLAIAEKLVGDRAKGALLILAEQKDGLQLLNGELINSEDAAKKMAETQRNTLGGALKLLQSAWEGIILKMNETGGVGDKLRKIIVFLADNLETIVTVVGYAVKAFVSFKVAMTALRIANFARDLGGLSGVFKKITTGLKGSADGANKLGKSLKGIGLGIAITLLLELAKAFYDIASGAAEARRQQDLFNAAQKKSDKIVESFNKTFDKQLKKKRQQLELDVARNIISEEQKDKELKLFAIEKKRLASGYVKDAKERIIALRDQNKALEEQKKKNAEVLNNYIVGSNSYSNAIDRINIKNGKLNDQIDNNYNKIVQQRTLISSFSQTIEDTEDTIHDYTVSIADNSSVLDRNAQSVNNLKDQLEIFYSFLRKNKDVQIAGVQIADVGRISFGEIQDTKLQDLKRNSLEAEYNVLVADSNISEEERINLLILEILARAELEKYGKSGAEQQIIDLKALKQINALTEKQVKIQKELAALLTNKALEFSKDLFIKQIDEKIAKIDEETEAHKRQANILEQLAVNGNITAKESLVEERRLIAEANAEKERLEKKKQQVLLISSVLQAFNSNLASGDNSGEAFLKAVTSVTALNQFASALPIFLEGTEDTGTHGLGIDGKGGFKAILHPNERVLTKEQNLMIGDVSNDELAKTMYRVRNNEITDSIQIGNAWESHLIVSELMNLQQSMDSVKTAIENKPETNIELGRITQSAMQIAQRTTSKRKTTNKVFIVKK